MSEAGGDQASCIRTYDILGYNMYTKRHIESLSDNVTQEYACRPTGCIFIGL